MAEKIYNWTDDPMVSGVADCNTDVVNDCLMHLKYENTSDAIQNMYETGQVEKQSRAFNQLLSMKHSTFDKSKFTVVGSPTITDDGVASGFSNSNYLIAPVKSNLLNSFSAEGSYTYKTKDQESIIWCYNLNCYLSINKSGFFLKYPTGTSSESSTSSFLTIPLIDVGISESDVVHSKVTLSPDKISLTINNIVKELDVNINWGYLQKITSTSGIRLGNANAYQEKYYFAGSIDLKAFSITVDGKEVFNGNKTGIDTIKADNYEVVGSPVITDDGVASGWSLSNYVKIPDVQLQNAKTWKIEGVVDVKNVQQNGPGCWLSVTQGNGLILPIWSDSTYAKFQLYLSSSTSEWNIATAVSSAILLSEGSTFKCELEFTGTQYVYTIYQVATSKKVAVLTVDSSDKVYQSPTVLGIKRNTHSMASDNTIDLNSFKIYVDGKLVYQPCLKIPYTQSKTGSKVVDSIYRDRVQDLYEQEGLAGYYTIDEENQNFTLPMGEIYGMIEQTNKGWNPPLLTPFWTDHLLSRMDMLRSDTFSWHSGITHSNGYNELLSEYNNSASTTKTDTIGTVTITYKLTPKGYKICAADQVTNLMTLYNNIGIAWYYVLDTANKQFKLPRTKWGFKGLRDNVGNTIGETLPNITGTAGNLGQVGGKVTTGAFYDAGNSGDVDYASVVGYKVGFDASRSSSIYQDGAHVQEQGTQMYLYFYVGEFTQTAIEQTAGLNAELFNNKVDRDMSNRASNIHFVTQTYQNGTSGYRIWSDGYCEQWGDLAANASRLTFLKPFANTDYTFTIYFDNVNNQYAYPSSSYYLLSKTKTGITKNAVGDLPHWKACGYIV